MNNACREPRRSRDVRKTDPVGANNARARARAPCNARYLRNKDLFIRAGGTENVLRCAAIRSHSFHFCRLPALVGAADKNTYRVTSDERFS